MKETRKCTVKNKDGIHARPSALIVKKAMEFESEITITKVETGEEANAKSIMDLMQLAAFRGDELIIEAEGNDARQAVEDMVKLMNTEFNFREKDKK